MAASRKIQRITRCLAGALAGFMVFAATPGAAAEPELPLISESAVLMDADTGEILYEKDCRRKMYPASITKVMTGLLALSELDPEKTVTVTREAVLPIPRDSSHISLEVGEELTVEELLYALSTQSANDAANVLAIEVSGSLEGFAEAMTEKAAELGAENTHFTNAHGLTDPEHYTTAYDMALITAEALRIPGFTEYFGAVEYHLDGTNRRGEAELINKNQILPGGPYAYDGVLISKTGWTSGAQGTLVTAARREDTTLIVVALRSPCLEDKYVDTQILLDYGFSLDRPKAVPVMLTVEEEEYPGYPGEGEIVPPQALRFPVIPAVTALVSGGLLLVLVPLWLKKKWL